MRLYVRDMMLDALKRNEYPKGRIQMRSLTGEFCALGVLCDLYRQCKNRGQWVTFDDGPRTVTAFMFDGELPDLLPNRLVSPPPVVTDWAEMTTRERDTLMCLSDWGTLLYEPDKRPMKANWSWTPIIQYLETLR